MDEQVNEEKNSVDKQDDEISLIDLFAVLLRYKKMIIISVVCCMIFAVGISVISLMQKPEKSIMPNKYTPKALMLINNGNNSNSMSSMLSSSGLGSLAGLAGVSAGSSNSGLALYFAGTNSFLDPIVDKFNLVERYKIKKFPRANSRKALQKNLSANYDEDSGVFSISFTDIDPVFASDVVNYAVSCTTAGGSSP